MRTIRTYKKWLELGEPEHLVKSNIYIEDLSGNQKRMKIKELQKLLSTFDYWYSKSSDSRVYRKGKEQEDTIDKLVGEIGKDGLKLYRKYISTKESKETGTEKYLRNLIPEMMNVKPQDNRVPLGESGKSYLDSGSLYDGFQFFPPTPKPLSSDEKHIKRTMIYGKVYNGE